MDQLERGPSLEVVVAVSLSSENIQMKMSFNSFSDEVTAIARLASAENQTLSTVCSVSNF